MKLCTKCRVEKDTSEFTKNASTKDGLQWYCRPCMRDTRRDSALLSRYGVSAALYDQMYNEQKGCCKICEQHSSTFTHRLAVDHCHKTGAVRGLLCSNCNTAIGKLNDDISILQRAISYLRSQDEGRL